MRRSSRNAPATCSSPITRPSPLPRPAAVAHGHRRTTDPLAQSLKQFLSQRRREEEWMDAPGVDPRTLQDSLRFIRRVNSLLGYTRATIGHLKRFSREWKKDEPIRILDVATGSADIPRAIRR